jgi:hypothetical protein
MDLHGLSPLGGGSFFFFWAHKEAVYFPAKIKYNATTPKRHGQEERKKKPPTPEPHTEQ